MVIPLLLLLFISGWQSPTHAANDLEEGGIRYGVSGGIADMTYREKGKNNPLRITPGHITLSARLADTALQAAKNLDFDLTESNSFLIGEIVPDEEGAKSDSDRCRFKIKATNGSSRPQEIAFPNSEELDVELQQGVIRPGWQPLKYATPAPREEGPHRVALAPGDSRIFGRNVSKEEIGLFPSSLGPGYTEYVRFHAVVKLTNKTISFARDVMLRISPHRDSPKPAMMAKIGAYPKRQGSLEIKNTNWRCLGFACETPAEPKKTTVEICRELQGNVGRIKSFERDGIALGASELAMCNQK